MKRPILKAVIWWAVALVCTTIGIAVEIWCPRIIMVSFYSGMGTMLALVEAGYYSAWVKNSSFREEIEKYEKLKKFDELCEQIQNKEEHEEKK